MRSSPGSPEMDAYDSPRIDRDAGARLPRCAGGGAAHPRPRRGVVALAALALAGCALVAPPSGEESPATSGEASQPGIQPASSGEPAPEDTPARESATEARAAATPAQPPVAVLAPQDAEARIAERKARLAGSEELSLARAEAGYYMDVQEAQLRQQLHGKGTGIFRQGDSIVLRISGTAAFDTGRSRLNAEVRPLLERIARVLTEYRKTLVVVNSHTDAAGDAALNQRLSEQRAIAVARHLIEHGLAAERIVAVGHGESQPLDESGAPASGWPNRRIEIELTLILEETA